MSSSFSKAQKSHRRLHRERVNVLPKGFLERKKDYQTRAAEYNRRKDIFTKLRKKALDKNPDEFFFRMKSSRLVDGIHHDLRKDDDEYGPEELRLIQTQDLNYVNYRHSIDRKKLDKLRSELHQIDPDPEKPKNKHIFFVGRPEEKRTFDIAERMKVKKEKLMQGVNFGSASEVETGISNEDLEASKELKYRRLNNIAKREEVLRNTAAKMAVKKQLLNKKEKAKKVKKGTKNRAPIFEWKMERKK